MINIKKELKEGNFLREPTEERIFLYHLMRKKFPKGNEKSQLKMAMEFADDRISAYIDMLSLQK